MSASKKITAHLGKQKIAFEVVKHRKVFTAYDLAQTAGEKLENVAKTLLVKVELPSLKKKDERYYTIVVPASYYIDLGKLKKALKAKKIELVLEKGMKKLGIEPGALTPFGSLRGFGVVVDKALLKSQKALVGAESFTEHLRMKVKDIVKAENPIVAAFGKKNTMKLQKVVKQLRKRVVKKGKKKGKKR
jgi:prolyl-tRNA editing enzyme YbaK/EbsC (Cys-tRNA(Pro) deacylase)